MATELAVAERLNNAINALAFLNPNLLEATQLNERWTRLMWEGQIQRSLPGPLLWPQLRQSWLWYAAARRKAPNLSERTPEPWSIEPTMFRLAAQQVRAMQDAPRELVDAAVQSLGELDSVQAMKGTLSDVEKGLSALSKQARPIVFVAVVAMGAWMLRGWFK